MPFQPTIPDTQKQNLRPSIVARAAVSVTNSRARCQSGNFVLLSRRL